MQNLNDPLTFWWEGRSSFLGQWAVEAANAEGVTA